jgi:chromosome segregation ATPase
MANAFQFRSLLGMGSEETTKSTKREVGTAPAKSIRADRSAQVRGNLDVLMRQIEHARRDADQMIEEISALEVEAGRTADVQRENTALREKLDQAARELSAEAAKAENDAREIVRLKEELSRIRQEYERSEREASANAMDATRVEDRLRATITALDEAKRDLETQREAREKAELDAACLRTNLRERDRAQNALMQSETELRMQNAKLQSQYDEVTEALARKERVILEKSAELESSRDRIADLETSADASREELRILGGKYSDVKISRDARLLSLTDGLDQERESHRMTRKLLEEERTRNEELSDEIAALKDQTMMSTKDTQKHKRELNAVRSQLHEYSDKLK